MKNHVSSGLKFSLVLATIHRVAEVDRFLASLAAQGMSQNIELIIVDQNLDNRLLPLIQKYGSEFSITRVVSEPGLSKARNIGLQHVTGDLVAFPDDDCWYPKGLLNQVVEKFSENQGLHGLTCKCVDEQGQVSMAKFDQKSGWIDKYNVWHRAISFVIFLRKEVTSDVGGFDEMLGVGAKTIYGSGEETDYLIRATDLGYKIYYYAEFAVGHPRKDNINNRELLSRTATYAPGIGYVIIKNNYPLWRVAAVLLRPILGAFVALLSFNFELFRVRLVRSFGVMKGIAAQRLIERK